MRFKDTARFIFFTTALLLSFCIWGNSYAQSKPFRIDGKVDADTGTVALLFVADSLFYPGEIGPLKSKITGGKFAFEGSIPYPIGVQLVTGDNRYQSAMFIIEPGTQSLICRLDSNRKTPLVANKVMTIDYGDLKRIFKPSEKNGKKINDYRDSLNKKFGVSNWPDSNKLAYNNMATADYAEHDKILLSFIQTHPNSYLGLWKLTELLKFGYEPIFNNMYAAFSPSIRGTYTGKVLGKKLWVLSSAIVIGKPLPGFKSVDAAGKRIQPDDYAKYQFTLVDFWYSNCGPCIAQFADLKKVYADYHTRGLNIMGISTDKETAKANWLKVIKDRQLPWQQYWDKNGIEAKAFSIEAFPTNFLVDAKGIVLAKDISPLQLREFLKDNLKN